MKRITLLVAFIATFEMIHAQAYYNQSIGVRLSSHQEYAALAASYKFFITKPGAIELNLGVGNKDYIGKSAPAVSFAGTYQHHFDIKRVNGLRWYIGGGAVVFNTRSDYNGYNGTGVGIYPTGGVDYKFKNIPLNLSADFRPTFHITAPADYPSTHAHDIGVSARYTF